MYIFMPSNSDTQSILIEQAMNLAKAGHYAQGLEKINELGEGQFDNTDAVYVSAVCLRKLGKNEEALSALEKTLKLDTAYVRAHQEMGHIFLSQGSKVKAVDAYEKALAIDSALIASWRALIKLYAESRNQPKFENAKIQIQQLEQLPAALQAVKSNLNQGKIEQADIICRQYLQKNKSDIEGMRLLAMIALQAKILDDAEFILESAVAFDPKHIGARYDYANVLLRRQKFGKAHDVAKQLNKLEPNSREFKTLLASTTTGIGDTDDGVKLYRQLIAEDSSLSGNYLLLGHAEKTRGELTSAVESYQKLYQLKADCGDAFWSLANTKTYKFTDSEIEHMRRHLDSADTSDVDKVHFYFALGKALEDNKDFSDAFEAYDNGNNLNKKLVNYHVSHTAMRVDRHIKYYDTNLYQRLKGVGHGAKDPIFIVGLPRAGSTLLEQILASHSQVDGTLELPNIPSLVRRLQGRDRPKTDTEPQYPKNIQELDESYFSKFGQQYIEDTQIFRQGAPLFIDKLPNNFLYVGLIKLILPNAKIIDARRHPMSCCFSGFKQLFAEGQDFTYGLNEVGDYYQQYVRLMDHWDEVLPGFVLRVQHEDVVDDLETQVRRILEFCGLPFEDSCLEFYKTERNIRTPSSEQVRQPIYKTGLEQWRNFESHLQPLIDALGDDVLKRYPIK